MVFYWGVVDLPGAVLSDKTFSLNQHITIANIAMEFPIDFFPSNIYVIPTSFIFKNFSLSFLPMFDFQ